MIGLRASNFGGLALLALTGALATVACTVNEDDDDTNTGGSAGTPSKGGSAGATAGAAGSTTAGSGGSTAGSGGAGGAGPACSKVVAPAGTSLEPLIDNLEDDDLNLLDNDDRSGYWYMFSDGTHTTVPAKPADFTKPMTIAHGDSERGVHFTGTAKAGCAATEECWGAGVGFVLVDVEGDIPGCFNATQYKGLQFWTKGTGKVTLNVRTFSSESKTAGGGCATNNCGLFQTDDITLTDSWTLHTVPFTALKQAGHTTAVTFNANEIVGVDFVSAGANASGAVADFDITIDDVSFAETIGAGGTGGAGGAGGAGSGGASNAGAGGR